MVKIAIAGGSSDVAKEVIDVLVETGKHEILLLTRKINASQEARSGVTWAKVQYDDSKGLKKTLQGVHTVLSFIDARMDEGGVSQKHLIDACVQAGVRRFAPSEWASSSFEHMSWYDTKGLVREYLWTLNKDNKILEYSLFQPGLFTNYLTYPHNTTNHLPLIQLPIDFDKRRAIVVDNNDVGKLTLTTVHDLASIVTRAIDYEGEWPVVGGIIGSQLTLGQIITLGEKIRGGPFAVEKLGVDDLEAGNVKSSWLPGAVHPSFPPEQVEGVQKAMVSSVLLAISAGALEVTDEWNQLLPDYICTSAEKFLAEAWSGKP